MNDIAQQLRNRLSTADIPPGRVAFQFSVGKLINGVLSFGRNPIEFYDIAAVEQQINRCTAGDRYCITIISGSQMLLPSLRGTGLGHA